MNVTILE